MAGKDDGLSKDDNVSIIGWAKDLTYREVHLTEEGLFDGYIGNEPQYNKTVQGKVTGDSWYYKMGYIVGDKIGGAVSYFGKNEYRGCDRK